MKPNRPCRRACCAVFLAALMAGAGCTHLQTTQPAAAPKNAAQSPPVHIVTRPAAKPKPQLDAVFEAIEMAPVKLEPKVWTDLTVLEALPHGARVKRGDVLVKLDTEKLKEQIEDSEKDQPAATLALELAVAELENLEQTTPLKLETAKRTQRVADEDLAYFEKTGRAAKEKAAQFGVKSAEQRLDGANEELKQLAKMYKADDLVEETEEIILRRQKFAVESAEYGLEVTKQNTDWSLKNTIPREAEVFKNAKRDQDLALGYAGETLPRTLAKKRLDVEKQKRDQKKAEKRLADLKKDLDGLARIRSPMDGIVYYGACESGKWTTGAIVAKKLVPSGKLAANEVFMTIVNPEKLVLKAIVQEGDLGYFAPGLTGQASPVSASDKKLPVKVAELSSIPMPTGGFEARLSVQTISDVRVVPGMNCKVSFVESQPPGPLRVPKEAIFTADGRSHVFVFKAEGQQEKRAVKIGSSDDKTVEILQGLAEGEKVLLTKPK